VEFLKFEWRQRHGLILETGQQYFVAIISAAMLKRKPKVIIAYQTSKINEKLFMLDPHVYDKHGLCTRQ
jgi:hypothetical protein